MAHSLELILVLFGTFLIYFVGLFLFCIAETDNSSFVVLSDIEKNGCIEGTAPLRRGYGL